MSLDISQIVAVSYPAVLAESRSPANQWLESAAMREMERQGAINKIDLGEHIEAPLDYRPNPDGGVMSNDMEDFALTKTEVITSASFPVAQIAYPVVWSKGDDAKNPTVNQKISLVKSLLENGLNSHDNLIEQLIFNSSVSGGDEFSGLNDLVPDSGQGTPGGIDANTETWWRNFSDTYTDATDIEAAMTTAFNTAAKGSGSPLAPKFLLSGATAHALYESVLQSLQRFVDVSEADGGYKVLAFKTARYVFSQYGDDHIYFLNPKSYKLVFSKQYFRDKSNTLELQSRQAFRFFIYSAGQAIIDNKSRLAVLRSA